MFTFGETLLAPPPQTLNLAAKNWELAPAYDITFAHNPRGEWTSQHLMSVNGKYKDFIIDDMLAVADRFGIGEANQIIRDVRSAVKSWPSFAQKTHINQKEMDRIKQLHIFL